MSNILEVTFESGQTFATAQRLWKGDYGQILLIHGPELPSYYEVHFASTKDGTPEVSVGTPSGVQIPNRLLQAEGYIYAWVFLHVGANDGYTKFQVKIPVEERGIPIDQETPEDQTAVQQAIAALNAETGRAEAAADAAEVSEQNAKASEDAAALSEQNAEDAAQAAAVSAENAAISETGAAESEAAAAASAQQAATSAEAAAEYAASAGGSEELVEEYARRAKGSADTAELYGTMAVNAKDAAEASARSATQASQAAVSAKNIADTAAQTATQKASEASSSAGVASSQASMAAAEAAAASGYANNAEGSARQAAASAEDAADSADDADDSAASARLNNEQAQAAKVDAQTAAGNASAAQTAAEAAQTAAETAQGKAEDAQTASETAQGLAEAAQAAAEAAQYVAEDAADQAQEWAESIDPDSFARPDGTYDGMTVGNAKQLVSTEGVEDTGVYLLRPSGGNLDIGDREADKLIGGTVAWNQLVQNGGFISTDNWYLNNPNLGTISANDGVCTVTITAETSTNSPVLRQNIGTPTQNHVFLMTSAVKYTKANIDVRYEYGGGGVGGSPANKTVANTWTDFCFIFKRTEAPTSATFTIYPWDTNKEIGDSWQIKNVNVFDLTQMFGSTLADYIYSLEQAEAGAGVAWFRKLFLKPYYEYNAGELMSVNASAHITTGFNQWDEEWEVGLYSSNQPIVQKNTDSTHIRSKNPVPVIPQTTYFMNSAGKTVHLIVADADGNVLYRTTNLSDGTFTTPENGVFVYFNMAAAYGTTYNHDICINLSSAARNGEYEPYKSHRYALDHTVQLRGIPKLDDENQLYYDGDTYEADGTVTRRFGIVDLGTLSWSRTTSYANAFFYANGVSYMAIGKNVLCPKYLTVGPEGSSWFGSNNNVDKTVCIASSGNQIFIRDDSYSDKDTFRAAMSGVYLVYELATPTTEQADIFAENQVVDTYGTEAYEDYAESQGTRDVAIPVGHHTLYQANLKDKLQHLPNLAQADGAYYVQQTGKQMRLRSFDPYSLNAFPTDKVDGPVASFPDGADDIPLKSLIVDINPVQDLHGYDSPWPAGGGKNLFNKPERIMNVNISQGATIYSQVFGNDSASFNLYGYDADNTEYSIITCDKIKRSATIPVDLVKLAISTSGLASLGGGNLMLSLSDFTNFAPYENLCPISGWDKVEMGQRGKNLFDPSTAVIGKYYGMNGIENSNTDKAHSTFFRIKPLTRYCMTGYAGSGFYSVVAFDANMNPIIWYGPASKTEPFTTQTPANAVWAVLNFNKDQLNTLSFYESETVGEYVPCNPASRDIIIQLGDTYYGAQLDVLNGVLRVTHGIISLGAVDWTAVSNNCFRYNDDSIPLLSDNNSYPNAISSIFVGATPNNYINTDNCFHFSSTVHAVYVRATSYSDAASFKTAMSGQTIVYELATPIPFHVDPHDIYSFLGFNNIWADTGDTHAIYRADIGLYIQKLTGSKEDDMIANNAIASGKYFLVGNRLFLSTAAIAAGATLTPGTNCVETNLAAALNALNS